MVFPSFEPRADQLDIYLGSSGPIALSDLRSFFYRLEKLARSEDYFGRNVELALADTRPGSLGLTLEIRRKNQNREIEFGESARYELELLRRKDREFDERLAEAAERQADAAERSATAGERSAKYGKRTMIAAEIAAAAAVAAVFATVIAGQIKSGELSAPIYGIDKSTHLTQIIVTSAVSRDTIEKEELPDRRTVIRVQRQVALSRRENTRALEVLEIERLVRRGDQVNLIGRCVREGGRTVFVTRRGNTFPIAEDGRRLPFGDEVFMIADAVNGLQGLELVPQLIEPVHPL